MRVNIQARDIISSPAFSSTTMDDIPIHKLQIPGPILSSLLHRFISSPGSLHGLLYGNFIASTTSSLSDDDPSSSDDSIPLLTVTITSFVAFPSHFPLPLHSLPKPPSSSSFLLGWFSGRRNTPLSLSLKESTTTITLSTLHNSDQNAPISNPCFPPSVFLLLTTPLHDQLIHTHEYKAFHYRISSDSFEPKSLDNINIGPSFRANFGSFSPDSQFPLLASKLGDVDGAVEDYESMTLNDLKQERKDQKRLNWYSKGFEIERLRGLMGSSSTHYTAVLEDLYEKMLNKLDGLARSVESSSAQVLEQEKHNRKLRRKVAGLE